MTAHAQAFLRSGLRGASAVASFRNPVLGAAGEDHGDPFVLRYLDSFYLYHTGETSGRRGVSVYRSSDLVAWEFQGYALEASDHGWAWSDLWAPEVVYDRGLFLMFISATAADAGASSGPWHFGDHDAGRRLGVARSTSPIGPFVPDPEPLTDSWAIDGHPFRDDDGAMWLFYNVRTAESGVAGALPGTGTVCDRLLAPDRLEGRPSPVTFPTEPWEGVPTGDWFWNEGPYVLKRRGRYHQMYSGGSFVDATYAVGVAEAPTVRGPWHKHAGNPIFRGSEQISGPGHHSFVYGPDAASRYAVYHGYVAGDEGRKVHVDRLLWCGDRPLIAGPTDGPQPAPARPVLDPRIPHWRAEAWVRGAWVEVGGARFGLSPSDVWHQVEATQSNGRVFVRTGGVLRSSHPVGGGGPRFASDGDVAAHRATSYLEDGMLHALPRGSTYVWRWGGGGRLELSLALRGAIELELDGGRYELESDEDRYRLVRLEHGGTEEVRIRARTDGTTVTDLFVYARP